MSTGTDGAPGAGLHDRTRTAVYAAAAVLAAIPALRMASAVRAGSALPYGDYWLMLPHIITPDGGTDLGGFFQFQNEHPVVIAKVLYWINLQLFAGSNISLGLMVVGVVVLQVVVVGMMLLRSSLPTAQRAMVLVLTSVLLFSYDGAWNFIKSMSGAAWLPANLFALSAIYLRSRDRTAWALGSAVLASMSYGTGIAAWLAVGATGAIRRPWREWWKEWPAAVGFIATFAWYRASNNGEQVLQAIPSEMLHDLASLVGFAIGLEGSAATSVGMVVLAVAFILSTVSIWRRTEGSGPWVGMIAYGAVAGTLITYGRSLFIGGEPINRYHSLPALLWIGLIGLVLVHLQGPVRRLVGERSEATGRAVRALVAVPLVVPLVLMSWSSGGAHLDVLVAGKTEQELGAIALRLRMIDDLEQILVVSSSEDGVQPFIASGQYPFADSWDDDCGLLGEQLDSTPDEEAISGAIRYAQRFPTFENGVVMGGSFESDLDPRCIVFTGADDVVVGAATFAISDFFFPDDPDDLHRFRGAALDGESSYRAYVIFDGSDEPTRLAGEVAADDIEDL